MSRRGPIDLSDDHDKRLIGDAIAAERPEVLRRLLQATEGLTSEMMAALLVAVATYGSEETLEVLIELGARMEQPDSNGQLAQVDPDARFAAGLYARFFFVLVRWVRCLLHHPRCRGGALERRDK